MKRVLHGPSVVLSCALPFVACAGDADRAWYAAADSAGVEIIDIDRDRVPGEWQVAEEPSWILGADDGLTFHEVMDARLAAPGVVLVADGGSQQILRVVVRTGDVARIGRRGRGPGEFRGLRRVLTHDDGGIRAYDIALQRYTDFDAEGTVLGTGAVPYSEPTLAGVHFERSDAGDFYVAVITGLPEEPTGGAQRGVAPVVRLGERHDTITFVRGHTTFMNEQGMGSVIFGATSTVAGAQDGLWIGDTDEPQVSLWRHDVGPDRIVRWRTARSRQVTPQVVEDFWHQVHEALQPEARAAIPEMRRMLPVAERLPAFGQLQTGPRGELWIGDYHMELPETPTPATEWLVVDIDAATAARVVTPAGLNVTQVGEDFVLGVHRDALGVETVRSYPLLRTQQANAAASGTRLFAGGLGGLVVGGLAGGTAGWAAYDWTCDGPCEIGGAAAAAGAALGATFGIPLGVHFANGARGRLARSTLASAGIAAAMLATLVFIAGNVDDDGVVGMSFAAAAVGVPLLQIRVASIIEQRTSR